MWRNLVIEYQEAAPSGHETAPRIEAGTISGAARAEFERAFAWQQASLARRRGKGRRQVRESLSDDETTSHERWADQARVIIRRPAHYLGPNSRSGRGTVEPSVREPSAGGSTSQNPR